VRLRLLLADPTWWGAAFFAAATLIVLGWAASYPVTAYRQVAPTGWIGLWLACAALAGLVATARSPAAHALAAAALLALISAPHWLALSWGSDAGSLANLVAYRQTAGPPDLVRDVAVSSYFQWPAAIVLARLLADLAGGDPYTGAQLTLLVAALAVGPGLWALLERGGGGFWGLVAYWAGSYWLLNWQAVPYVLGLALLLALLALLDHRSPSGRFLLLLLLAAGLETHPLVGAWFALIVGLCLLIRPRPGPTRSLLLLILVAQGALLVYKNARFLIYIVDSLRGRYAALAVTGTSARTLAIHVRGALTVVAEDPAATALKALSWLALAAAGAACLVAVIAALRRRRCDRLALAITAAGALHLALGMGWAALGPRAIQLLGVLPAWWVADAAADRTRTGCTVRLLCTLALALLPAVLMRAHLTGFNFIAPADRLLAASLPAIEPREPLNLLLETTGGLPPASHLLPLAARQIRHGDQGGCRGPSLVVETAGWRREMALLARQPTAVDSAPILYDNGPLRLRYLPDCAVLGIRE
jgi:hypothetical protein